MHDSAYCYPNSSVLINKLNIRNARKLLAAEIDLTSIRLQELESNPLRGSFDFLHLRRIHKYIFQDLYTWAGEVRTVEIGKGNLFCTTACIDSYAACIFDKYFRQCYDVKENKGQFVETLAKNYGDLNALHPFREGNGRAQREFARVVCKECGYDFRLACTTHAEILAASKLSFNTGNHTGLSEIFSRAVSPIGTADESQAEVFLKILTSDDLTISSEQYYTYVAGCEENTYRLYNEMFVKKIDEFKKRSTEKNDA